LLEETKQRQRLQQEARTIAKLEQLEIEICEKFRRQLRLEHLELSGELECSDTDTARQYTLRTSDDEEDLVKEQDGSSTIKSELETPDEVFFNKSLFKER
jgi:hypothetical protein